MKKQAQITIIDGKKYARTMRDEACASCRACRFGEHEEILWLTEGDFADGELVTIELKDRQVPRIALILYGLPLLFLVVSIAVCGLMNAGNAVTAVTSIVCCAAGLAAAVMIGRKYSPEGTGVRIYKETLPEEALHCSGPDIQNTDRKGGNRAK